MVTPEQPEPLELARTVLIRTGGAESNVAMYLAGLGHCVEWVSRLGDDPLGRRVLGDVSSAGVGTALVEIDALAPTGVYFKDPAPDGTAVYYYRRGSAASAMSVKLLAPLLRRPPRLLHLSGITPALSEACGSMMSELLGGRYLEGVPVSFDVNFREGLWPRAAAAPRLAELAQHADIVFVGLDEARVLWGAGSPREVRALLDRPSVVVVKDGPVGATAFHDGAIELVAALGVEVREPVGAGDAFAAGWLSGFLRGLPHRQRLRLGHLVAARALSSTADHVELPSGPWFEAELWASEAEWAAAASRAAPTGVGNGTERTADGRVEPSRG